MGSKKISRLTVYTTGETISANEHNAEHQQYVDNFNELFKSFDYDGVFHYPLADKVKIKFSNLNLEEFLYVAHNPDGTIKSDGIDDALIYAHNKDSGAHSIIVETITIKRPRIIAPSDGAKNFWGIVEASPFEAGDKFYGTHEATDWEIATDPYFNNVVYSSYNDTEHLYHLFTAELSLETSTTYYVRVRYRSGFHISEWSKPVSFTTASSYPPRITNIIWNNNGDDLYDRRDYSVVVQASDPENDPLSYEVTCDDSEISITQDDVVPNKFNVSIPDISETKLVTFTYKATDGISTFSKVEKKKVVDIKDIVLGFQDIGFRSFDADSDHYKFLVGGDKDNNCCLVSVDRDLNVNLQKKVSLDSYKILADSNSVFIASNKAIAKLDKQLDLIKAVNVSDISVISDIQIDGANVYLLAYWDSKVYLLKLDENLNAVAQKEISLDRSLAPYNLWVDNGNVYLVGHGHDGNKNFDFFMGLDQDLTLKKFLTFSYGTLTQAKIRVNEEGEVFVLTRTGFYKFDSSLNFIKGLDINDTVELRSLALGQRGEIYAVGYIEEEYRKGLLLKIDQDLTAATAKVVDVGDNLYLNRVLYFPELDVVEFAGASVNDDLRGLLIEMDALIPEGTYNTIINNIDISIYDLTLSYASSSPSIGTKTPSISTSNLDVTTTSITLTDIYSPYYKKVIG